MATVRYGHGHGHVLPRADGAVARCGGPALCSACQKEYFEVHGTMYENGRGGGSSGPVLATVGAASGEEPEYERDSAGGDDYTDVHRHAGRVKRYHTWAVHHQQTVGEHSWQVARVYRALWVTPDDDGMSVVVYRYILDHDTAELVVGDPPFPVKANDPTLKASYDRLETAGLTKIGVSLPHLAPKFLAMIKIADLVEMMEFGMTEREMGNLLAVPIVVRTEQAALGIAEKRLSHAARALVRQYCDAQWVRHERVLRAGDVTHSYSRKYRGR